jgi:hypothetical protein
MVMGVSPDEKGGGEETSRLARTCKEELQFSRSFSARQALLGVGSERHVVLQLVPGGVTFGGARKNGHYDRGAAGQRGSLGVVGRM